MTSTLQLELTDGGVTFPRPGEPCSVRIVSTGPEILRVNHEVRSVAQSFRDTGEYPQVPIAHPVQLSTSSGATEAFRANAGGNAAQSGTPWREAAGCGRTVGSRSASGPQAIRATD
jgi:hypothetical protein